MKRCLILLLVLIGICMESYSQCFPHHHHFPMFPTFFFHRTVVREAPIQYVYVEQPQPQVQVIVERRRMQQPNVVYVNAEESVRPSQDEVINPNDYANTVSYSEMWKESVWFNEDCYKIDKTYNKLTLDNVAQFLKEHMDAEITIHGYASKKHGTYEYNKRLSSKRCVETRNYLVSTYGISKDRIGLEVLGTDNPQYYADNWNQCVVITCE